MFLEEGEKGVNLPPLALGSHLLLLLLETPLNSMRPSKQRLHAAQSFLWKIEKEVWGLRRPRKLWRNKASFGLAVTQFHILDVL